jgi:hypothetical protein
VRRGNARIISLGCLTVNVLLSERYGFAQKVFEIELTKKDSHAKAQRRKKTVETRQHFAPLRLCVKNLLPLAQTLQTLLT